MVLFDVGDDPRWTNTTKPYDRDRPFHRINSPSYDESFAHQPDGHGYECGCRSPEHDYDPSTIEIISALFANIIGAAPILIMKQLVRAVPNWVPVERRNVPPSQFRSFPEKEKEVEGVLWRSFQTWTDVPMAQWHLWYDWNFHILPAKGYKYLRGKGNDPPPDDKGLDSPLQPVGNPDSMECEWDCGAFTKDETGPDRLGPMFLSDWCWPLAGQYIWIAGRWIYDCGHATSEEKTGQNAGLMRTELHPCKAVASARWEAFNFDENGGAFVPAVQFMFFACKKGGYKDFQSIDDLDYEFIVDLPRIELGTDVAWPIGHTPDFNVNTVVLRPRLLKHFNYPPFENAFGSRAGPGEADPEIVLMPPPGPGKAPEQVRIKIPLTKLKGKNKDSYGVIVSLGWHDPASAQAATVRKITVTFSHVQTQEFRHEGALNIRGEGEWTVKVGVNGRWLSVRDDHVVENHRIPIGKSFQFFLAENDFITIASHGLEEDDVGEFMDQKPQDRKLHIFISGRREARWDDDIDQPDNERASVVAREIVARMASTWSIQNDPLGLIDPDHPMFLSDSPNPIKVKDLIERVGGLGREMQGVLTACVVGEVGDSAELAFDPTKKDYLLNYGIRIDEQKPRS